MADGSSVRRAGRGMAVATLASRTTGFVRVLVLAAALGLGSRLLDSYNVANALPNTVYELIGGGAMASVVVPLLSRAALEERDGGVLYAPTAAVADSVRSGCGDPARDAAGPVPGRCLYTPGFTPSERHLAVVFSRFFLPQILFYGMSASAGAVLNMRGRFAAPMWAPLVNNVVVIAVTLAYLAIGGGDRPETLTASQTLLRGGGRLRARPGAVHRIYDPAVGSTPCRTPGPRR